MVNFTRRPADTNNFSVTPVDKAPANSSVRIGNDWYEGEVVRADEIRDQEVLNYVSANYGDPSTFRFILRTYNYTDWRPDQVSVTLFVINISEDQNLNPNRLTGHYTRTTSRPVSVDRISQPGSIHNYIGRDNIRANVILWIKATPAH